jgi:hypothetical protein
MYDRLDSKKFKVVIADESHLLKTYSTQRTKKTVPLLKANPSHIQHPLQLNFYIIASEEVYIIVGNSSAFKTQVLILLYSFCDIDCIEI